MEISLTRRLPGLRFRGSPGWLILGILVVGGVLAPLLAVLSALLTGGGEQWSHIVETVLSRYVLNTFVVSVGVIVLSTVIGVGAAWYQTLYDYPLRRVFDILLVLPLAIPAYVNAFTYSGIFGYTGAAQRFFREFLGMSDYPVVDVHSAVGLIVVLSFVVYPYTYLTVRAALRQQSMATIEAARTLTPSGFRVFFSVGLPLLRPAIAAGASLVLMETLNEYGAAVYYGVETLSVGVFRTWFAYYDLQSTRFLSSIFLLIVLALLVGDRLLRGRKRRIGSGTLRPIARRPLARRGRASVYLAVGLPTLVGFAIPVTQLLHWARLSVGRADWELVVRSTGNTALVAGLGAGICILAAVVVAYAPRVSGGRLFRHTADLASLGYAIPGAVVAIGIMSLLAGLRGAAIGSIGALLFAYTVRYLAVAQRPLSEGFSQVSGALDEAGRSLGHGPTRTLTTIDLPVMSGTLATAAVFVFVDIIKELPLTTVLRPFNFPTLAVEAFRLAGDERLAESSVTALILITVGSLPILGHRTLSRLRRRRR
ncbi:MAG: ABC transporter permease [Alkalispirochaetaceae bacterium]